MPQDAVAPNERLADVTIAAGTSPPRSLSYDERSALLQRSTAERLAYFHAYVARHSHLDQVHQRLVRAICDPVGPNLILVFGPTRVGKTTLRSRIERHFLTIAEEAQRDGTWDPGHIPFVSLSVPAEGARPFTWRNFYERMLRQMDEPLIDRKITPERARSMAGRVVYHRSIESDLRLGIEHALVYRHPFALLIDEGQHIALRKSSAALLADVECLKSLIDLTRVPIVLFGSYELLLLRNLNAQLSGRSIDIHFARYQLERDEDIAEFRRVVRSFAHRLPLARRPDLERQWEYLYRNSIGSVGVLKTWLTRALDEALKEGSQTLTRTHLDATVYPLAKLHEMVRRATEGEQALATSEDCKEDIVRLLGFDMWRRRRKTVSLAGVVAPAQRTTLPELPSDLSVPHVKGRRRVGQRLPTRDPVGRTHYAG